MGQSPIIVGLVWTVKFLVILFLACTAWAARKVSKLDRKKFQVLVVGDIGRSPRIQYHALSIAQHGGQVQLIGYQESDLHPEVAASKFIAIRPIALLPKALTVRARGSFVLFAPVKVLHQVWSIWRALQTKAPEEAQAASLLVQNPPSIPTIAIALLYCRLNGSELIIDWHNFGYSILALRLGQRHPLVLISTIYERLLGRLADVHFCVTDAMQHFLANKWAISEKVSVLHDRPADIFRPLDQPAHKQFMDSLLQLLSARLKQSRAIPGTHFSASNPIQLGKAVRAVSEHTTRLVVSSTSWTADEDFSILLDALVSYDTASRSDHSLPPLLVVITGKGPRKSQFEQQVTRAVDQGRLQHIDVITVFFQDLTDYAKLLACADLGISLHTSSSGLDFPMKVIDMFGAGLPVAGRSDFEAWSDCVVEGVNGLGFTDAQQLSDVLQRLFQYGDRTLAKIKKSALAEGRRRWEDEWNSVAAPVLGLNSS